jgi:lysophospholipase L1-like esterase
VVIAAHDVVLSDALDMDVDRDHDLAVSIAVGSSGALTWHVYADTDVYATAAGSGDRTTETSGRSYAGKLGSYVVLTGLQVHAPSSAGAIVGFGDSITDGGGAAPGKRWLDVLGGRLRKAGRAVGTLNAGIACNSLTLANRDSGPKAPDRLDIDVLNRAGVDDVIVFEGTNDVYAGVSAERVIAALTDLATRIRTAGKRVIGATLIPRQDAPSPSRDAVRRAVNDWIRSTKEFDGVIDFDAVIRSPRNVDDFKPVYLGDDIHPNAAGHIAMGNAISLRLFSR